MKGRGSELIFCPVPAFFLDGLRKATKNLSGSPVSGGQIWIRDLSGKERKILTSRQLTDEMISI